MGTTTVCTFEARSTQSRRRPPKRETTFGTAPCGPAPLHQRSLTDVFLYPTVHLWFVFVVCCCCCCCCVHGVCIDRAPGAQKTMSRSEIFNGVGTSSLFGACGRDAEASASFCVLGRALAPPLQRLPLTSGKKGNHLSTLVNHA